MRVSRSQAAENRNAVIEAASRLFRRHGFDGIGLKDLMKGAGLTQGAFYKQFESKEDLAAQASQRAMEAATRRWSAAIEANPADPIAGVLAFYLSMEHRGEVTDGCPIVALGADAVRHGGDVKHSFEQGVRLHLSLMRDLIAKSDPDGAETKAIAVSSLMVGALTFARLVEDPELARKFLDGAAQKAREIVAS
jgi:TetR/AcrR family transcriptional repressor of nem operon